MSVPFIYVNGNLTVVVNGRAVVISKSHPLYTKIIKTLETTTEEELEKLLNVKDVIKSYSNQKCSVVDGEVYYNGEKLHGVIVDKIKQHIREDLPFKYLVKFLENIKLNPSYRAQNELYDFLEHCGLPITEDGCFLAYKAVTSDYLDKWSHSIDNKVGNVVSVPRDTVDDDRERGCSYGLHVGGYDYVKSYTCSSDNQIIVKVNPKDVVSVPRDCDYNKLRTCSYEVIDDFKGLLDQPLYDTKGQKSDLVMDNPTVVTWTTNVQPIKSFSTSYVGSIKVPKPQSQVNYHNKRDKKGRFTK